LLEELIRIEESLGRARDHARNVSRPIDIDLLYRDANRISTDQLELPHPRTASRAFVLRPLADIRPGLVLPNQSRPVAELLAQLADSSKVVRSKEQW
jgi:2-amino-4-hydroxy-6-hydroxymethyldihydropteridine diphosphokinase